MPAQKKGFTLIELLVVIAIIAILSVIGFTVFTNAQKGARDSKRRSDIDSIAKALEIYKSANGNYPQIAQSGGGPWFCDSSGNFADNTAMVTALSPYFSTGIPRDPIDNTTYKYRLDLLKDQNWYWLYATLENPPATLATINGPGSGDPAGDACFGGTVHVLIRNQQ